MTKPTTAGFPAHLRAVRHINQRTGRRATPRPYDILHVHWRRDRTGHMIDVDEHALARIGCPPEEVIGMKWMRLHPRRERTQQLSELRAQLDRGVPLVTRPLPSCSPRPDGPKVEECRRTIIGVREGLVCGSVALKINR